MDMLDGGGGRVQLDKSRDVVYFNSLDVISNNLSVTQRFGVSSIVRSFYGYGLTLRIYSDS